MGNFAISESGNWFKLTGKSLQEVAKNLRYKFWASGTILARMHH